MKQRIISAMVGLIFFFSIMFLLDTIIFNIVISIVAVISVYELLSAIRVTENKYLLISSLGIASIVPFLGLPQMYEYVPVALFLYFVILICSLLYGENKMPFEKITSTFFITTIFPLAISSLIFIRDEFQSPISLYYILLVFAFSWGSDTGAYFVGKFFGKTKLAPDISPKKTIEGVYGGVLSCYLFVAIFTALYILVSKDVNLGSVTSINYIALILIAPIASLIGVSGDLSASIIKRQYKIKDFGNIIPGHGGVVDRFDSVFFIAPFFYIILKFIPIIING